MPFLLSSSYKFNSSSNFFLEIGLFTSRNFEPVIAFSGSGEEDFLILNFVEYTQFIKVLTSCNTFFTLDVELLRLSQFPSQNIGDFLLTFDISQATLFVRNNTQAFRVTRPVWIELCNFRDVISLKFNILEKYTLYARILYSRFVNFISQQQPYGSSPGITANELLLYAPTNIIPEHKYIRIDIQQFDSAVCQLLDAEIRLFCLEDVFRDSKTLRENESVTLATYFTRL